MSYALEEERPSVPTDIDVEDRDCVTPHARSSVGPLVQPLLDRITQLTDDNISAQRDLDERNARIKELRAEPAVERTKLAGEAAVPSITPAPMPADRTPSRTDHELLHQRMKATEDAARRDGAAVDRLNVRGTELNSRMADMFASMQKAPCPLKQVHLCLLGFQTAYGDLLLHLGCRELSVREFLSDELGLFGQGRSALVDRSELDVAVKGAGNVRQSVPRMQRLWIRSLLRPFVLFRSLPRHGLLSSANFASLQLPCIRS